MEAPCVRVSTVPRAVAVAVMVAVSERTVRARRASMMVDGSRLWRRRPWHNNLFYFYPCVVSGTCRGAEAVARCPRRRFLPPSPPTVVGDGDGRPDAGGSASLPPLVSPSLLPIVREAGGHCAGRSRRCICRGALSAAYRDPVWTPPQPSPPPRSSSPPRGAAAAVGRTIPMVTAGQPAGTSRAGGGAPKPQFKYFSHGGYLSGVIVGIEIWRRALGEF